MRDLNGLSSLAFQIFCWNDWDDVNCCALFSHNRKVMWHDSRHKQKIQLESWLRQLISSWLTSLIMFKLCSQHSIWTAVVTYYIDSLRFAFRVKLRLRFPSANIFAYLLIFWEDSFSILNIGCWGLLNNSSFSQIGLLTKSSSTAHEQRIIVKNTKNEKILITVKEHIPKSTDDKIKVLYVIFSFPIKRFMHTFIS